VRKVQLPAIKTTDSCGRRALPYKNHMYKSKNLKDAWRYKKWTLTTSKVNASTKSHLCTHRSFFQS